MFDDFKIPGESQGKVEDIFDGVEPKKNLSSPALEPRIRGDAVLGAAVPSMPQKRGHFRVIIVLVVILLLVVVGLIMVFRLKSQSTITPTGTPEAATAPTSNSLEIPADNSEINGVPLDNSDAVTEGVVVSPDEPTVVDSDNDGLTDTEEVAAGSNPLKADSDSDGLNDYDEVKVYQTNPVNSDTDGDSYLDGEEILNGYNPKGAGKLLNFQQELNKIKVQP